jgi:cyclohexa-1,5-dienecarbonyl-CoA hydratase
VSPGFRVETAGSALVVSLERPPVNVLHAGLLKELRQSLEPLRERRDLKALVLRSGLPGIFSAGVDVAAHAPERIGEMLDLVHGLFRLVDALPQAAIAVVDGRCLGGAAELVALCDFVYASPAASFAFPEIDVGCFPPLAAALLPRLVGRAAADLVLTGREVGADEAARLGLVSSVSDDPMATARALVERLGTKSGAALALGRKALREANHLGFEEALARAESIYREELATTRDAAEGVAAFLEKRAPRWTDR